MRDQRDANTHHDPDPAEIQAQVDQAREHLRGTIDEIGTRMNVRAMAKDKSAKLTDRVRSGAGGASKLTDRVRSGAGGASKLTDRVRSGAGGASRLTKDKARNLSETARTDGPKQLRSAGTQVAAITRTRNGKAALVAVPVALLSLLLLRRIRKH